MIGTILRRIMQGGSIVLLLAGAAVLLYDAAMRL